MFSIVTLHAQESTAAMQIEISKSLMQSDSFGIVSSSDDLLTEILRRLPTEPLIRCKTVSKRWQSLITSPDFRRRWNLNPVPAAGLFCPVMECPYHVFYEFVHFSRKTSTAIAPLKPPGFIGDANRIVQSCNGLFLCCRYPSNLEYYVYNPTTDKTSNLVRATRTIRGMCLAFDPTKSPNHYKVVCVHEQKSERFQIEIYSSRTRAWRTCGQPFIAKVSFENGVYWNNAIHWISKSRGDGDSLYFNVHHHVLEKMPNPPSPIVECWRTYCYFGESCDHLHYVRLSGEQIQFHVYEMRRDYSGWFVKYRVDLSLLVAAKPEMVGANPRQPGGELFFFSVFCVVRGEEGENGSFLVVKIPGKVIRYNLVSKTFEELQEIFEVNRKPDVVDIFNSPFTNEYQYVESLCSL